MYRAGPPTMAARLARLSLPALAVACLLLLLTLPAVAQDDHTEGGATEAPRPAVPAPDEAPAPPEAEWSYRFLVPATLLLGTVAVVGTIIMYFVRVTRARYRVIK